MNTLNVSVHNERKSQILTMDMEKANKLSTVDMKNISHIWKILIIYII